MQRPCRGVRCEHKVNAAFSPEGTCERGAAAWERRLCGAAFSDGVVRACARQGARVRDGAEEKIVALCTCTMERTGTCGRSERAPGRRPSTWPRASELQGPVRGDRGTGRGAVCLALARWSGRPCGRSRGDAGAEMKQRRRRHGRPRGRWSHESTVGPQRPCGYSRYSTCSRCSSIRVCGWTSRRIPG